MPVDDTAPAAAPGVYVGPYLYAKSRGWLRRHAITHVINVTAILSYLSIVTASAPSPARRHRVTSLRLAIEEWRR